MVACSHGSVEPQYPPVYPPSAAFVAEPLAAQATVVNPLQRRELVPTAAAKLTLLVLHPKQMIAAIKTYYDEIQIIRK